MKIDLVNDLHKNIEVDAGDVIVYSNEDNIHDYYMLIINDSNNDRLQLLDIATGKVVESFDCYRKLIKHIQKPINNYHLKEIIKSNQLELKKII